jgi:hypothetical protein
VPGEAVQVTAVFEVLVTTAENCFAPPDATVAVAGETVTTMAGGLFDEFELAVETPEHAARPRSDDTNAIRIAHWDRLSLSERRLL